MRAKYGALVAVLTVACPTWAQSSVNPALANLADNTWVKLSPSVTSRYVSSSFTTTTQVSSTSPAQRSYSGAVFGGGKIFYFGGGHASYSANDVELYDMGANVWTQQYTPEPLPAYCQGATSPDPCQIENGDASGSLSPMGRPWPEHTYQTMTYDPRSDRFLLLRGQGLSNNGLFAFLPSTRAWQRLSANGSAVHGPDHATMYLTYDPDLQKLFAMVTVSNPGVFELNENGASGTWSNYSAFASPPFSGYLQIYGNYDASSKLHLVHLRNIVSGESAFFLYDAAAKVWTPLTKPSGMASDINSFTYDSLNQVMLIAEANNGAVRVWALKTSNVGGVRSGTFTLLPVPSIRPTSTSSWLARWSVFGYDRANNVAFFLRIQDVGGGGTGGSPSGFETWAYRYQNDPSPPSLAPAPPRQLRVQ